MMDDEPKARKTNKRLLFAVTIIVVFLVAFGLIINRMRKPVTPLPSQVTASVNFPIFFPSSLPAGYTLDKNSASVQKQIVFFSVSNHERKVSISEQAVPKNLPDLSTLQKANSSFKKMDAAGGQALYGVAQSYPVAIVATNTTLINMNGTKNTPLDVIVKLVQNLNSIAD
jgi:hypothetical protein